MNLENNHKILLGSILSSIDRRLILGEGKENSVIFLAILVEHLEYAKLQQAAGVSSYGDTITTLENKINELKYKCSDICNYRNKIVTIDIGSISDSGVDVIPVNGSPTVDDNTLNTLVSNSFQETFSQLFSGGSFIENFTDPDQDTPNLVRINSLPIIGELTFLGNPVQTGLTFPVEQSTSLEYSVSNVRAEVDGVYVYTENIDNQISQLIASGYSEVSYQNGIHTYQLQGEDIISSEIDGTFDSLPGDNVTNSNVTAGGWLNGTNSADTVSPDPDGVELTRWLDSGSFVGIGLGAPTSPQGGNYAGISCIARPGGFIFRESFFTLINVVQGESYVVNFHQMHAGLFTTNTSVEPSTYSQHVEVIFGDQSQHSSSMPFLGGGNQIWESQSLIFVANITGEIR